MERPKSISSGEAMRWNEDVNRRRLAHHERRCAEDAMYRKAYEYMQADERRMWEQVQKPFAEMLAAEAEQRCVPGQTKDGHNVMVPVSCAAHQMPENVEHQPENDCMKAAAKPQRIKTHEEVLRERAAMEAFCRMSDPDRIGIRDVSLSIGLVAMMFTDKDGLKRRMKEMEEMKPYLDEIRETDKRFRSEEVHLSGFEW